MNKSRLPILLVLVFLILSIFLLMILNKPNEKEIDNNSNPNQKKQDPIIVETQPVEEEIFNSLSLNQRIDQYLDELDIDPDLFGYKITDLESYESISHNSDIEYISASMYKLPLAMLYYDEIYNGYSTFDDLLLYEDWMGEEGGPIYYDYLPGQYLDLAYLLNVVIEASDNTAGHILYTNMGGWEYTRELILKYSSYEASPYHYDGLNYMTSDFVNDVLIHIYENQEKYEHLIESMDYAQQDSFLNYTIHDLIPQKTGNNDNGTAAGGINFRNHPYTISFLSHLGYDQAQEVMGNISKIVYNYYKEK